MIDANDKKIEDARMALERGADGVGSAVASLGEDTMRLVKANPGKALLVAIALGYVAGRLLSRR